MSLALSPDAYFDSVERRQIAQLSPSIRRDYFGEVPPMTQEEAFEAVAYENAKRVRSTSKTRAQKSAAQKIRDQRYIERKNVRCPVCDKLILPTSTYCKEHKPKRRLGFRMKGSTL